LRLRLSHDVPVDVYFMVTVEWLEGLLPLYHASSSAFAFTFPQPFRLRLARSKSHSTALP